MKRKAVVIFLAIALVLGVLTGAIILVNHSEWFFPAAPTEIQSGFSSELLTVLETQYGVTIPADAQFIKGFNTNAFRDPSVIILFECPLANFKATDDGTADYRAELADYVCEALALDKTMYSYAGKDDEHLPDLYQEIGGQMEHTLKYQRDTFTWISYTVEQGKLLLRFTGRHPGATFK